MIFGISTFYTIKIIFKNVFLGGGFEGGLPKEFLALHIKGVCLKVIKSHNLIIALQLALILTFESSPPRQGQVHCIKYLNPSSLPRSEA